MGSEDSGSSEVSLQNLLVWSFEVPTWLPAGVDVPLGP